VARRNLPRLWLEKLKLPCCQWDHPTFLASLWENRKHQLDLCLTKVSLIDVEKIVKQLASHSLVLLLSLHTTLARDQAQKMESKCAVLFFDEIDALGQSRGGNGTSHSEQGGGDGCSRRVLAELLIQLNRINSLKGGVEDESSPTSQTVHFETGDTDSVDTVYEDETSCIESVEADPSARVRIIVVAATNRPEDCDPALVRRFSVRVIVGLPSLRDRKKIIKRYLKGIGSSISQEQLQEIAAATDGWSGSDLESLTREAAMAPVRDCIRSAALLKRRRPHREQRRGISSCQVDALPMNDDSYEEEHEKLLEQFRNLRHVTFEDFEDAIAFWTLNHNPNTPSAVGRISPRSLAHYDSSSDEDD
jgi:SpoVK/Ycf46/Vps4 family AAA+-type ATPase